MFGLRDSRPLLFLLGAVLFCACPPASGTTGDTDATMGATTTGTTSTPDATTTGDTSTSSSPTGSTSTAGPAPTTGDSSTGEPPGVTCEQLECAVRCTEPVPLIDSGGRPCTCDESLAPPPDWQTCELPEVCGEDYLCVVQALRWRVISHLRWSGFEMDDGSRAVDLDVLGGGVVRSSVSTGEEYACCDSSTQDLEVWYGPYSVPAPDSAFWASCFTAEAIAKAKNGGFSQGLPYCLNPEWFVDECTGSPLDVCPAPPRPGPDPTCAETCPMAGDGVCDEAQGTGLCPAGCDPLDCTCDANVPEQCDEVGAGGPCPVGSDPIDCTCEVDRPGVCDEVDDGGRCPLGSDPVDCR